MLDKIRGILNLTPWKTKNSYQSDVDGMSQSDYEDRHKRESNTARGSHYDFSANERMSINGVGFDEDEHPYSFASDYRPANLAFEQGGNRPDDWGAYTWNRANDGSAMTAAEHRLDKEIGVAITRKQHAVAYKLIGEKYRIRQRRITSVFNSLDADTQKSAIGQLWRPDNLRADGSTPLLDLAGNQLESGQSDVYGNALAQDYDQAQGSWGTKARAWSRQAVEEDKDLAYIEEQTRKMSVYGLSASEAEAILLSDDIVNIKVGLRDEHATYLEENKDITQARIDGAIPLPDKVMMYNKLAVLESYVGTLPDVDKLVDKAKEFTIAGISPNEAIYQARDWFLEDEASVSSGLAAKMEEYASPYSEADHTKGFAVDMRNVVHGLNHQNLPSMPQFSVSEELRGRIDGAVESYVPPERLFDPIADADQFKDLRDMPYNFKMTRHHTINWDDIEAREADWNNLPQEDKDLAIQQDKMFGNISGNKLSRTGAVGQETDLRGKPYVDDVSGISEDMIDLAKKRGWQGTQDFGKKQVWKKSTHLNKPIEYLMEQDDTGNITYTNLETGEVSNTMPEGRDLNDEEMSLLENMQGDPDLFGRATAAIEAAKSPEQKEAEAQTKARVDAQFEQDLWDEIDRIEALDARVEEVLGMDNPALSRLELELLESYDRQEFYVGEDFTEEDLENLIRKAQGLPPLEKKLESEALDASSELDVVEVDDVDSMDSTDPIDGPLTGGVLGTSLDKISDAIVALRRGDDSLLNKLSDSELELALEVISTPDNTNEEQDKLEQESAERIHDAIVAAESGDNSLLLQLSDYELEIAAEFTGT